MRTLAQPEVLGMARRETQFMVTAVLALVAVAAGAADETTPPSRSEPTKCYRAVYRGVSMIDHALDIGGTIKLCGGTTDAEATIACYVEAVRSGESGGLGLDIRAAIDLCSPAGARPR
jgi:hypothetical protein